MNRILGLLAAAAGISGPYVTGRPRMKKEKPLGETWRKAANLKPRARLLITSDEIRNHGLELRSGPRREDGAKPWRLEPRPYLGLMGADGKPRSIKQRIDACVRRAVALGLGKLERLEAR
jgi:hypothetical protein